MLGMFVLGSLLLWLPMEYVVVARPAVAVLCVVSAGGRLVLRDEGA